LPLVGRTPEREKYFDFTIPYLSLLGGIVVSEDDTTIADLEDLRGKRVAVMAGDNAEEYLRRNGFDEELTTVPVFSEAIERVAIGASDAVLMQRLVALRLIEEEEISGVRVLNAPVREFRQDFCFAVTEGDKELLSLLNDGLAVAIANGTLRQLQTKWFAESTRSTQTIVVGGDSGYPPFEFFDDDGRPAGYHVDLVTAIAEELGLDVEIRLGPWDEVVLMLERGDIDLIQGMAYSVERDKRFDFSPAHTIHRYVVVGRKRSGSPIPDSLRQLRTARIAVQRQDVMHEFAAANGLGENLTLTETQEEALALIRNGQVDYALVTRLTALHLVSENDWRDLAVGRQDFSSRDYSFAVPEGDDELLSLFAEGLAIIEETGRYREIYDRWLGVDDPDAVTFGELLQYSLFVLGPLLIVLLATFLWNRSLRTQVSLRTTELRESERKYRLLSDNTIDVIWLVTPQMRIRYVNPAIRSLTGHEPEQLTGERLQAYLDPGELRRIASSALSILGADHAEQRFTVETFLSLREGGTVAVEVAGKPLYTAGGALAGFQGIARDIADRKQYEATLTNTMQRKQWLTTIATAYLARSGAADLLKSTVDQLGAHFTQLIAVSFNLDRDGALRESYRYDTSGDRGGAWGPINLVEAPALLAAIDQAGTTAIRDVAADPITAGISSAFASCGITALALAPVPVGEYPRRILAFAADRPVDWSRHELLSIEEHANLLRLIFDNEKYQRMMDEANRSLEVSVKEKQTLLQEVHHRVKNNLNVVISLLHLQEAAIESVEQAHLAFEESRNRIYSMALVHESLYRSDNLSEIHMGEYLRKLVQRVHDGLAAAHSAELRFDMEPVLMDISRAVPCGIIVNELATNAVKHAFMDQRNPRIVVSLRDKHETVEISVRDNGVGMPDTFPPGGQSTLGLTLVRVLAEQIDGELEWESDEGTGVTLRIPR
jgi:PAS domain S-box-containing protein